MQKGKRITIKRESVDHYGVITATKQTATVLYRNGDNLVVRAEDGYIHEIDASSRDERGDYIVNQR